MKLPAWLMIVASAAPKTSIPHTATNTISSTIFQEAAMAINKNGLRLSPIPRKIALTMLYP